MALFLPFIFIRVAYIMSTARLTVYKNQEYIRGVLTLLIIYEMEVGNRRTEYVGVKAPVAEETHCVDLIHNITEEFGTSVGDLVVDIQSKHALPIIVC